MHRTLPLILAGIDLVFGVLPAGWLYYRPMFRKATRGEHAARVNAEE
jgi:hypothetical protein